MQNILKCMSQSMLDTENILLQNIVHVELDYAKYAKQNMQKSMQKSIQKRMQQNMPQICNIYIYIYNSKMIIFGEICIICKTNRPNKQN